MLWPPRAPCHIHLQTAKEEEKLNEFLMFFFRVETQQLSVLSKYL